MRFRYFSIIVSLLLLCGDAASAAVICPHTSCLNSLSASHFTPVEQEPFADCHAQTEARTKRQGSVRRTEYVARTSGIQRQTSPSLEDVLRNTYDKFCRHCSKRPAQSNMVDAERIIEYPQHDKFAHALKNASRKLHIDIFKACIFPQQNAPPGIAGNRILLNVFRI